MADNPVEVRHKIQHQYPEAIRFCALCGGELRPRLVRPDNRRHKVCSVCGFVYFQGPKLVAGCLVVEAGRVLLLRRAIPPQIGRWTFPGGYVDLGETAEAAARRETLEEVGMRVTLGPLLGIYFDPVVPNAAVTVYLAEPGVEPPSVSHEAQEVRYFAAAEIPWDEIAFPTTHQALRVWIERLRDR